MSFYRYNVFLFEVAMIFPNLTIQSVSEILRLNILNTLLKLLRNLENDLFIHTHKENNILFPKVLNAQKIAT